MDGRAAATAWMAVGLAWAIATGAARAAEPVATLPPPPPPPSSLETAASQIVKGLYGTAAVPLPDGASFAVLVRFDKPPEGARPDALDAHLADAIEAALRGAGPGTAPALAGHRPGARVTGEGAVERIEVELQVQAGHLAVVARRRALAADIWSALLAPEGRILGTAFSNVPVDLEVRTLLGLGRRDVKLSELRVVPVGKKSLPALATEPILDLAIGDFDGDAMPELAVLAPDGVRFTRWMKGGFSEEVGTFSLRGLPPARARVRAPLGRLVPVVRGDGRTVLVAASSDRGEPVVIGWGPAGPERVATMVQKGWPLYATGVDRFLIAPWPEGVDVLEGAVTEARLGTAAAAWLGPVGRVHDVRAFAHRDGAGAFVPVVASARAGGELAARIGGAGGGPGAGGASAAVTARAPEAGTAAVWVDFDADGELEALTTSAAIAGSDRLVLSRGATPGAEPSRWVGTTAAPVTAAVAGDVDRDGFVEIILATWSGRTADLVVVVPK